MLIKKLNPIFIKTKKTEKTETEAPETTPAETTSEETAAAAVTEDNSGSGGGMRALLIALGAAAGTFVVAGLIPVIVHKIYHKKLYQY